jgi:multisubunit Na+/H+ antiporter MnhE subunit
MKKLILGALALLALAGCGVSTPAVTTTSSSSTRASTPSNATKTTEAYLVFTADSQETILVTVDGKQYQKETVLVKSTGSMKELQEMAGNIITLTPGTHEVRVTKGGKQVYQQSVSINPQERKIIKL